MIHIMTSVLTNLYMDIYARFLLQLENYEAQGFFHVLFVKSGIEAVLNSYDLPIKGVVILDKYRTKSALVASAVLKTLSCCMLH